MKIEEDDTVVFKSNSYYFKEERDGLKPNTVRLLTRDEMQQIIINPAVSHAFSVRKIRIECTAVKPFQNLEPFTRTLTSIEQIGELCGHYLFVFSW